MVAFFFLITVFVNIKKLALHFYRRGDFLYQIWISCSIGPSPSWYPRDIGTESKLLFFFVTSCSFSLRISKLCNYLLFLQKSWSQIKPENYLGASSTCIFCRICKIIHKVFFRADWEPRTCGNFVDFRDICTSIEFSDHYLGSLLGSNRHWTYPVVNATSVERSL